MTDPVETARLDGLRAAGYEIQSLIGRGGMAYVYRAEDTRLGRVVAVKVLAPELAQNDEFRQRFLRESRLAASLDHPNIIPIYEAGEADGHLYLAMRYVEGADLKVILKRRGTLTAAESVQVFGQVGAALDAAHVAGLVHRDVKPANILVAGGAGTGGSDHVYLSDFGLTKRASSLTGVTATGIVVGTMDYVAPEQIGGKPVDARTDVYALGCVVYQALTGRVPFTRDDDAALLWAHLMEMPTPVSQLRPEIPPTVDGALATAMAKGPEARFGSCGEFVTVLTRALQGLPDTVQGGGTPPVQAPAPQPSGPPSGIPGWSTPPTVQQPQQAPQQVTGPPAGYAYPNQYSPTQFPGYPSQYSPTTGPNTVPPPYSGIPYPHSGPPSGAAPQSAPPQGASAPPFPYSAPPQSAIPASATPASATPATPASAIPKSAPPKSPGRGRKWLVGGLAVALVLAIGLVVVLVTMPFKEGTKHFSANNVLPASFDYPESWDTAGGGTNIVFSPYADNALTLFSTPGDGADWSGVETALSDHSNKVAGIYTALINNSLATGQERTTDLKALLPSTVGFNSNTGDTTTVDGRQATRHDGFLTDPSGQGRLRIRCFVADSVAGNQTVIFIFFASNDAWGKNESKFEALLKSVRFPA